MKFFRTLRRRLRRWNDEGCFIVTFVICALLIIPAAARVSVRRAGASEFLSLLTMGGAFVAILALWIASQYALEWFKRKRIVDPAFGPLEGFCDGAWHGSWSNDHAVAVTVFAGKSGPSEDQRQLFLEFNSQLKSLHQAIEQQLFLEYQECRKIAESDYRKYPELYKLLDADYPQIVVPPEIGLSNRRSVKVI